jgi:hypothetical protein
MNRLGKPEVNIKTPGGSESFVASAKILVGYEIFVCYYSGELNILCVENN